MSNDSLEIKVMNGIGDLSWLYSKFKHIPRPWHFCVADGAPQRSMPYLERLPVLNNGSGFHCTYGSHNFVDVISMEQSQNFTTWKDIEASGRTTIWLENNLNFLRGERIETWFSDLATDFHYEIITTEEEKKWADDIFKDIENPIGIFMANKRGQRAWKGWDGDGWFNFCKLVQEEFPKKDITFVMVGTFYDQQLGWEAEYYFEKFKVNGNKLKYLNLISQTHMGTLIETIKHLKYIIGNCVECARCLNVA